MRSPADFPEFESEVARLKEKVARTEPGATVFYGSSSIRLWPRLTHEFPKARILNLGFGGSTLAACSAHFQELVVPANPKHIVFFAGDNDLFLGSTPQQVWEALVELLDQRDDLLGPVPFAFLSIKPSPARVTLSAEVQEANEWCRREIWSREGTVWVDVHDVLLDEHGRPRTEFYMADQLHLSRPGYAEWNEALRRDIPSFLTT